MKNKNCLKSKKELRKRIKMIRKEVCSSLSYLEASEELKTMLKEIRFLSTYKGRLEG